MILTETGTLPDGIEEGGVIHREFELREQLIRDSVEIYDDPELVSRSENAAYAGVALMSRRITRLGELPTPISVNQLLDLTEADYQALTLAAARLAERRRSFRAKTTDGPAAGAGAAQAGAE